MKISTSFDSGNIEVVNLNSHDNIQLKIRKDTQSDFLQWFHFRLMGAQGYPCTIKIINAGETSYPEGWQNYYACASYDRNSWFRVPTSFNGKELSIEITPNENSIYLAYFPPYSYERHLDLVAGAQSEDICVLDTLGKTLEGREIDFLTIGEYTDIKRKIWVVARQHPGETMAEWFVEGLIHRLLDSDDPISRRLLEKCVFYIVPNANIDGSIHGNLRTNAAGINLNREWGNPSLIKSPEVYNILKKMDETGVDLFLDIHGDEALPYCFASGIEGIPGYPGRIQMLQERFIEVWETMNPDFQTKHGYPKNEPGKANLNIGSKAVANRYGCLGLTIELPFKDNANLPDRAFGWSPERSVKLGESVLNVIYQIYKGLR